MPNVPTTCAQYAYCLISIIRNLVEETLMMGSYQDIDAFQRCKIHNQIKVHQRLNVVVVVYKNNSYHFLHHFHTGTLIIFSCAQFSEKNAFMYAHIHILVLWSMAELGNYTTLMLGMYYIVQALKIKNFRNRPLHL